MKAQIQSKIENVNTLNDFLEVLKTEYKTDECKPGRLVKDTLIRTILNKLSGSNVFVNEALRLKVLESKNITEFIDIIKLNFNTALSFTESAKKDLVNNTKALVLLTNLKEK